MPVACFESVENIKIAIIVIIVRKAIESAHQLLLHYNFTQLKWNPIFLLAVFNGLFLLLCHLSLG